NLSSFIKTILGLSLAAFEKPTELLGDHGNTCGSKNSSSSNYGRTRRQKRRKLSLTSRTMSQWTLILLAEKNLDLKVEKHIKAMSKGSTSRFTLPTRTDSPVAPQTAPKATTPTTSATGSTRERVDNAPYCYKCSGLRHYARDCPKLKILAFVPDDASLIYDTDTEPKLDEPVDELVYPDRGEALVIQRVLNVVVSKFVDDNSWLHNNIFRTKCTFKGKFCDMLIDGGSCENVVSTYMVEKLEMKTEDHPKPYQLTWLKGNNVKVSRCCLVPFSISKSYKDEVWCKVIPMDEAHILLGSIRDIQHCIDFIPGSAIPNRPAYRMNLKEFAKLQRQVTELLEKELIRESMSPCTVHALLVPKHGGLFGCVLTVKL
nr:reverse transcriptase domain-containing protein [Tanacetum cinerariifolium]